MCLAASMLVEHRTYRGSPPPREANPVPLLAALFHRGERSIVAKMGNLDGSLAHGGRYDLDVTRHLLGTPGLLTHVYCVLLGAAREVGIDRDALPDFLGLEATAGDLLGQEELGETEVETVVQAESHHMLTQPSELEALFTERLLVAKARVGQHVFADSVIRNHQHRCVFCGLSVTAEGVRARRMLVASHIKPWRDSTSRERLDTANGLTACPTHDVAFDTGLITVNGGMHIHVKPEQERAARKDPAAAAVFGRPPLLDRLLLPAGAKQPGTAYLSWHHQHVYRTAPASTTA
ncbi:HNH endonuclease [Catellatospora vulcania]|uniref:HNH endonuclease n=1 Tax=Catellatospora vulcania TaxID=1460450 RepID=UPI0012D39CE5|nr:HNH endonuclease [Catellatospora vulcania]